MTDNETAATVRRAVHPPVRIGIVGGGAIGERHARIASRLPQIELAGICDPDPQVKRLSDIEWRRKPGAGPVLTGHPVDLTA